MKNGQICFALLLASALMGGCAKEDTLPTNRLNPAQKIEASFNFEVSGRSYDLSAVQYEVVGGNSVSEPTCGGAPTSSSSFGVHADMDLASNWTNYNTASKSAFITRQDLVTSPNIRIALQMQVDLSGPAPLQAVEATLSLSDYKGQLIPNNDDPANRKAAHYTASGEQLLVKVNSVKDNRIEGTFSGTLKTSAGASVEVNGGVFKATLKKY
jgi:hypothetical protein